MAIQSLNPAPIPYIKHCRWYRRLKGNPALRLSIYIGPTGERLGYIRAEPYETGQLLSWAISPAFQGQGLGKVMLRQWCEKTPGNLWAQIKTHNFASQKIAKSAGFNCEHENNGIQLWLRASPVKTEALEFD